MHLARVPAGVGARALVRGVGDVPGLRLAEPMAQMRLGAPTVSPSRLQVHHLALFCAWDDEASLDAFLGDESPAGKESGAGQLGRHLADGWHVRLEHVRRWGVVPELADLPELAGRSDPAEPVVAFTLARMRLPQVPRFIRWGRPVERLVRDHPGTTLALAAVRPPRTVATFSIWRSARAMTDMVFGRSDLEAPARHADAMAERERKDFHHAFTTLRLRPLSEHGRWSGRGDWVPR